MIQSGYSPNITSKSTITHFNQNWMTSWKKKCMVSVSMKLGKEINELKIVCVVNIITQNSIDCFIKKYFD